EIRIVLIGKTGVGKSTTGNTILRSDVFHKAASSKSVTKQCRLATTVFNGKPITVVDTPGWCDTELSEAEITEETVKCIDMSCPGPHVFLLIVAIGRFTAEEKKSAQKIQEIFGEGATKYTMVLFTRGDDLEDKTFDDYLNGASEDLKALLAKCDGRCQVFNNRDKSCSQVTKLLENIQYMVQCNGGGCYTNTTYQLVEKYKKREDELTKMMDEEEKRQRLSVMFMLHHLEIGKRARRQEEERIQRALSFQAAEHQRMMDLERQKQKEEQRKHQRHMESEELKRKNEEAQHRRRLEMERQRLEKEKQEISKKCDATSHKLEEQKRLTGAAVDKIVKERIRQNKTCVIS
ncbi:hypothetical protein PO909_000964, partial [Leuciscus waleckii]